MPTQSGHSFIPRAKLNAVQCQEGIRSRPNAAYANALRQFILSWKQSWQQSLSGICCPDVGEALLTSLHLWIDSDQTCLIRSQESRDTYCLDMAGLQFMNTHAQEAKQQILLAAPVSVTFLLNKSVNVVSVLVRKSSTWRARCMCQSKSAQALLPATANSAVDCYLSLSCWSTSADRRTLGSC